MSDYKGWASIGMLAAVTVSAPTAQAKYPLTDTLEKGQKIILLCDVDAAMMATECGPQFGAPASGLNKRISAFIDLETTTPDYLVDATPGRRVLVMIRRSTASPLDDANPGRALAAKTPTPQPIINPDWALMPSSRDLDVYFPERAMRLATSGSATARCTVGTRGDLLGCWVADETPSTFGFAAATLYLTTFVQMKLTTSDGSSTAGRAYSLHATFNARAGKITLSGGQ